MEIYASSKLDQQVPQNELELDASVIQLVHIALQGSLQLGIPFSLRPNLLPQPMPAFAGHL